jgi:Tfp pilus assembly pilus retraction ATPase PilT
MENKYKEQLEKLLQTVIDENGSDLHISAGHFPIIRINGRLVSLTEKKMVTSHDAREIAM